MCLASSIVEGHKKLFLTSELEKYGSLVPSSKRQIAANKLDNKSAFKLKTMSRIKSRIQTEVCGDCGASDPAWASINRGILLCSDCCSVHRSLGRHISVVKSLRQGTWEPSVLNFVNSLNAHGANSVWEYHLLDGTTTTGNKGAPRFRKPTPKDPLHPVKSDFIKAKHINLSFVLKPNLQDEDGVNINSLETELSKQLHASVRTSNLETSLRLLVQGADPNFYHDEKRSTPLHVAAKFGQASQIELLIVYGADLKVLDGNNQTAFEVAKANNHNTIADRLMDAMYEVTDRIMVFLGGKKADHSSGRHMVIPDINNMDISEQLKIARGRLQLVPNKMFEEMVMDLYDEVDRRENEAIWATSTLNADNFTVPFLPANPFLSATRNQGRQKLARFSRAEFAGLLTDVLIDARRRQNMANLRPFDAPLNSFYNSSSGFPVTEHDPNLSDDEPIYDPVASDDDYAPVPPMAQQTVEQSSIKHPKGTHLEMESLRKKITEYVSEINQLKTVVQKLSSENSELKSKFSNVAATPHTVYDEPLRIDLNGSENECEPLTLVEEANNDKSNSTSPASSVNNSNQSTIKRPASMYERRIAPTLGKVNADNRTTTSMYQMAGEKLPRDEVKHRTEIVTRRLKDLIVLMQAISYKDELAPCAERIRLAVMELIAIFPSSQHCSDIIRETLKQLTRYNNMIQTDCENLEKACNTDDQCAIEKCCKAVRDCVYYIASSTKTLVMEFD